jgi:hypothetical protein
LLDRGGGGVAVQRVAELGAGQAVGGSGQGGVDLPGERVAGGGIERPGGGALRVVSEREGSIEVLGLDGVGVVGEREPDRVRFGAGGELPGDLGGWLGELLVGV